MRVNFYCDEGIEVDLEEIKEPVPCAYVFTIRSKYVCGVHGPLFDDAHLHQSNYQPGFFGVIFGLIWYSFIIFLLLNIVVMVKRMAQHPGMTLQ